MASKTLEKRTPEINNIRSAAEGGLQVCKIAGRTPTECILINSSAKNPKEGPYTMRRIALVRATVMPNTYSIYRKKYNNKL